MVLMWFWFFGRNKADVLPNNGTLGTAGNTTGTGTGTGDNGNGQAPIGSNTDTGAGAGDTGTSGGTASNGGTAGDGSNGQTPIDQISYTPLSASSTYSTPAGVTWLYDSSYTGYTGNYNYGSSSGYGSGSGYGSSGAGNGFDFSKSNVNGINGGTISGSPTIHSGVTGADGQNVSLLSGLVTVIGGCLVSYGLDTLIIEPPIIAIDSALGAAGSALSSIPIIGGLFGGAVGGSAVNDPRTHAKVATETVSQCLARTLGRLAIQKITESTVDWINSGFDGQPAYVQDYNKFFSNVADEAAGSFIEGSDLAFLCSPFQLQIKIAIAQSYAHSRGSQSSCTLSQVVGNVQNFMDGDFSDGGWPGLISFTTEPTNNPYGAYMYAQIALTNAQNKAIAGASARISPGGFLSQEKCDTDQITQRKTNCKIVTPGSTIEASLVTSLGADVQTLQLGDSINQILGALSNALVTKLLYNGLSNVSSGGATSNTNTQATGQAATLMSSIQSGVAAAQQYASAKQRIILDIQSSQQSLAVLADCWAHASSSPGSTPDQAAQGASGFADTVAKITQLQVQVTQNNNTISAANSTIAELQGIQTDLLLATTPADVTNVQIAFTRAQSSTNPKFYTTADVTAAGQDRTTVQASLAQLGTIAAAELVQCRAISH